MRKLGIKDLWGGENLLLSDQTQTRVEGVFIFSLGISSTASCIGDLIFCFGNNGDLSSEIFTPSFCTISDWKPGKEDALNQGSAQP